MIPSLDEKSLQVFAEKGTQGGSKIRQQGNANAVKVRRVLQIVSDLARKPFGELRILDVACGEGVYSIEAGLRGAQVLGFDARTERMSEGMECARINNLQNVTFQVDDVRKVRRATHGTFDVIFLLGIIYHLDVPDVFSVLESMCEACSAFTVIDTHIALDPCDSTEYMGRSYHGRKSREHADDASPEAKRQKVLMSIDNTFAFQFSRESLVRLLRDVGFTSVFECEVPLEPGKPANRVTLVAHKGTAVELSTYPWLNGLTEEQISEKLKGGVCSESDRSGGVRVNGKAASRSRQASVLKRVVNRCLRVVGYEMHRVK